MKRKIKQNTGFTLVELLTVIALLSILLTLMIPTIQQCYFQIQMDTAILQLHKDIRYAQRLADQYQKSVNILFIPIERRYEYRIIVSGKEGPFKTVYFPENLTNKKFQTIIIEPDKSFRNNNHIMIQKGEVRRYVYYYQSGRSRVTAKPE